MLLRLFKRLIALMSCEIFPRLSNEDCIAIALRSKPFVFQHQQRERAAPQPFALDELTVTSVPSRPENVLWNVTRRSAN